MADAWRKRRRETRPPGADDKTAFRRRGPVRRKVCRFCADKDCAHRLQGYPRAVELRHRARQGRAQPHHGKLRQAPAAADHRHQARAHHCAAAVHHGPRLMSRSSRIALAAAVSSGLYAAALGLAPVTHTAGDVRAAAGAHLGDAGARGDVRPVVRLEHRGDCGGARHSGGGRASSSRWHSRAWLWPLASAASGHSSGRRWPASPRGRSASLRVSLLAFGNVETLIASAREQLTAQLRSRRVDVGVDRRVVERAGRRRSGTRRARLRPARVVAGAGGADRGADDHREPRAAAQLDRCLPQRQPALVAHPRRAHLGADPRRLRHVHSGVSRRGCRRATCSSCCWDATSARAWRSSAITWTASACRAVSKSPATC